MCTENSRIPARPYSGNNSNNQNTRLESYPDLRHYPDLQTLDKNEETTYTQG
jgi:hypothetical protein